MTDKHYLIVGGSSGIGKELTKLLIDEGNQVSVISRGNTELNLSHANLFQLKADVTNYDTQLPVINEIINGLVYCPGTINLKPLRALKQGDFQNDLNINLLGAVRVIQNYLPQLQKSETASIVLFSTVAVQTGMPFHASIAAAKGAVEGFGRSIAAELAPKIRVNVIAPSLTNTPLAEKLLNSEAKLTAAAARHPLNKIGTPNDIANLAAFLLSDKSSWITGQILKVDGGISAIKS